MKIFCKPDKIQTGIQTINCILLMGSSNTEKASACSILMIFQLLILTIPNVVFGYPISVKIWILIFCTFVDSLYLDPLSDLIQENNIHCSQTKFQICLVNKNFSLIRSGLNKSRTRFYVSMQKESVASRDLGLRTENRACSAASVGIKYAVIRVKKMNY